MITNFTRQSELINSFEFNERINVIGCGALGSWLVFFLLKMGFSNIHVYDFDIVEEHNLPNQMFAECHINDLKVTSIEDIYIRFFEADHDRLIIHTTKVDESIARTLSGIVFCCVDSMSARKEIYESCYKYGKVNLWIEGRIGLFGAYVYTLDNKDTSLFDKYEKTLYADETAEVSACGISQTALPSAVNCSSIMLMQMISKHRGADICNEILYQIPDLTSMSNKW